MSAPGNKGLSGAFASLDKRVVFYSLFAAAVVATLVVHGLLLGWLSTQSAATSKRLTDAARMERIVKQTWWIEEDNKLTSQMEVIKKRFWKGDTIGLVRADIEKFLQDSLARHGLKVSNLMLETKAVDIKGIAFMRAQVKLNGPSAGVIRMLNDLALGPNELFVSGIQIRFLNEQAIAEVNLDAPTLVSGKSPAPDPAPK